MVSQPSAPMSERPNLSVEQKRRCIRRLERCIDELKQFDPTRVQKRHPPEVIALEKSIEGALVAAFGERTAAYYRYSRATNLNHGSYAGIAGYYSRDSAQALAKERADTQRFFAEGKETSIAVLQQAARALEDEITDEEAETTRRRRGLLSARFSSSTVTTKVLAKL